ncbi:MAG: MGMT family protein, partial [Caldilineaceae bacterium]
MSTVLHVSYCPTPIGLLEIEGDDRHVRAVTFVDAPKDAGEVRANAVTEEAATQLAAYFDGARRTFELPLAPQGTPFQRAVWAQLRQVPFGETATYRDIALALDNANGVR